MRRVVTSARAELRLSEAARWLADRGPDEQVLIVGATYESASELIRFVAQQRGSGFGWHRMTLGRLAAELAKLPLAERDLAPIGVLPIEAMCTRVLHGMRVAGTLGRLEAVADQPGLPRALARTLGELRMARVDGGGPELSAALAGLVAELARGKLADRAAVFEVAEQIANRGSHALLRLPTLVLDVRLRARAEQTLLEAVLAAAPDALITVPGGDDATLARLGGTVETIAVPELDALSRVQKHLFDRGRLNYAALDRSIEIFSAPGESRECVELARRVLAEAEAGVPFDRMAIALRTPGNYRAHLEEAFGRAGVPVYFEQGTVRPHPSGRAFLALLACASEGLSARRFAEYVSIAEVPDAVDGMPPPASPAAERWVAPDEELSPAAIAASDAPERVEIRRAAQPPGEPSGADQPVVGGTLRAPWRWERLLVEAAVIGGRDRWQRRLAGLEARLALDDADAGRESRARMIDDLRHLRTFALPLLDELASLPERATWGTWLDRLSALATRTLRAPERVLSTLSALVPMADVGPVTLRDVQLVLAPRLAELIVPQPTRRYGHVLIAPVEAIRGMTFDVVFVPGLAERMFPPKLIEDPLLLDVVRLELGELTTRETRVADERLALRLALGAACKRAVVSYPRIDLDQGRPRVPSFYGLEVLESAEGALPGFDELGKRAEATGAARIGWPAPADRERAIDEAEHDLALLDGILTPRAQAPAGAAVYLLNANPHLARSLRFRARRWTITAWKPADGMIAETASGRAALDVHAPTARSFSPTALELLAQCPYRFALRTVLKLEPREQPEAIETLGPLERGSLIHDIHFELLGELREAGELPIRDLDAVRARLDVVIARVAARYRDDLCPAIDRVWDDGIAAIAADAREWLRRMVEDPSWIPRRFELAFGPTGRGATDPSSVKEPVDLGIGLSLRGSIDLVEEHVDGALRATDYKTGAAKVKPEAVTAGGTSLQPVLYALVLERLFDTRVQGGRLYYCTSRGEFRAIDVALGTEARAAAKVLADTVADHFARWFFPAAPAKDACRFCDYKLICGPFEEARIKHKREPLIQLGKLRGQR
jgi:ATP-dependent helicase/nuclease subunit B